MARELYYTSARKGLKPGTHGFCTVARSDGLSNGLVRLLESLSAYKSFFSGHTEDADKNPVSICHFRASIREGSFSILSRIGAAGRDHTNRDNKLAHHIVLEKDERPAGGPAWLASQGIFAESWQGEPRLIDTPLALPDGDDPDTTATTWDMVTGDAGWAGALANCFENQPNRPVYLVYEAGMDVLPLVAEAVRTLPAAKRWLVTFNTYFFQLTAGVTCGWRCCPAGSPQLKDPRLTANAWVIDLTRPLGDPPLSHTVKVARGEAKPALPKPRRSADSGPAATNRADSEFVLMRNRMREKISLRPDPDKRRGDV
ncbi:MAG: hypothetical protein RRC34_01755 [Lentisphaeria bacterium]|nr:hypothetical protein [Lentisphaeria bacterium]